MNIRIGTVEITQRFLQPPLACFEHKPYMLGICADVAPNSEAQFKRHVEAGGWRGRTIELNTRHVMNRITA